jgi:sporulation protein YtfJ
MKSVQQHPIENIMRTTMENIKEMIDVNTIVGDAVETADGNVIIPISRVCFGFMAGGGEYRDEDKNLKRAKNNGETDSTEHTMPFAGGTGAGVSVTPIAFLVVGKDKIKLLPARFDTPVDRVIEMVPQVVEEIREIIDKHRVNINKPQATLQQ